jgi:hypothetical protein
MLVRDGFAIARSLLLQMKQQQKQWLHVLEASIFKFLHSEAGEPLTGKWTDPTSSLAGHVLNLKNTSILVTCSSLSTVCCYLLQICNSTELSLYHSVRSNALPLLPPHLICGY